MRINKILKKYWEYFKKVKVISLISLVLIFVFVSSNVLRSLISASGVPWVQTDWSGGVGVSTSNQYSLASNIDATTTAGQVTLGNTGEKFTNTGFETDLSSWQGGVLPTSLSNLQLWLKADAIGGLNNGDQVTTWSDSSSNNYSVSQAIPANKPLYVTSSVNNLPGVHFVDNNDMLIASTNSPFSGTNFAITTFVVGKMSDSAPLNYSAAVSQTIGNGNGGMAFGYFASQTNRI